jgi:hypothetical protein
MDLETHNSLGLSSTLSLLNVLALTFLAFVWALYCALQSQFEEGERFLCAYLSGNAGLPVMPNEPAQCLCPP